ncbi:MAG: hypothetical protein HDS39_05425 [Bacteroides sp.]|nr:hypothetical protein [Bacteroides sp.]
MAVHSLPSAPRCGRVALPSGAVAVRLYRSNWWPCRGSDAFRGVEVAGMSMKAGGCAVHPMPSVPGRGRVAPPSGGVAVYLYSSNWWPCRGSDALPRG